MPLISVVLPVYNVAEYVDEAITSILNQTIQDFEILVIDDCSTDETLPVVKSFKDSRIRIIEKSVNKGLIDSLNIGFKEAKGTYIARMDGDDISLPSRFEKQLKVLQNNPEIKACGCWLQCFGVSSKVLKYKELHEEIKTQMLLANSMSLCSSMLERKTYVHFNFDETKTHAEDYDFWAKSAWTCKMYNIQETLYYYRTHKEQVSILYNDIQKVQDVKIKLSLLHKIDYDKERYEDVFIKRVLFSKEAITVEDCKHFFKWLNQLKKINKVQQVFDHKEFIEVLNVFKQQFVFYLFFTNCRKGINYSIRISILNILPFKQKWFVIKKKINEIMRIKTNKVFKKSI
ncbi:glycosyltransferase family 2 protein [Tamlana fucoidanivorans]|uniref:Glycosyltransferase family 2 protein n=1 Tax=Allotamlana fucoidanivorans TaxID=2583814 RepID=A0A5C4SNL0_9FLAO|nr:glycosyltransferase family 2 protein [Tamlana fucoidanivorans]TNJ45769.1 glycosyltransferase family 2 protein [Tamlana fucoidanivorans]